MEKEKPLTWPGTFVTWLVLGWPGALQLPVQRLACSHTCLTHTQGLACSHTCLTHTQGLSVCLPLQPPLEPSVNVYISNKSKQGLFQST